MRVFLGKHSTLKELNRVLESRLFHCELVQCLRVRLRGFFLNVFVVQFSVRTVFGQCLRVRLCGFFLNVFVVQFSVRTVFGQCLRVRLQLGRVFVSRLFNCELVQCLRVRLQKM